MCVQFESRVFAYCVLRSPLGKSWYQTESASACTDQHTVPESLSEPQLYAALVIVKPFSVFRFA